MEKDAREAQAKAIFSFISYLINQEFFTKKEFCTHCGLSKNSFLSASDKKKPSCPRVLTENFLIRITLDILLHVPMLVKKIYADFHKNPKKNRLFLVTHSTHVLFYDANLRNQLQNKLEEIVGYPAKYLINNIKSYEELVEIAKEINSLYKG